MTVSSVMQCQYIKATMDKNNEDPEIIVYRSDLSYVKTRWRTVDVAISMDVSSPWDC